MIIIAARQSPELGIAEHLISDYVDGLREMGWKVQFQGCEDPRGNEDVAVHYHPADSRGIARDADKDIPMVIINGPLNVMIPDNAYVLNFPNKTPRDRIVNEMDEELRLMLCP